jgi:hemoglobin
MTMQWRREQVMAEIAARTGIDEAMIDRLVRAFHARAMLDGLPGPVFASRIGDWELHLQRIVAFWSSVALTIGRYHGQPMRGHLALPVGAAHSTDGSRCSRKPPRAMTHSLRSRASARALFVQRFTQTPAGASVWIDARAMCRPAAAEHFIERARRIAQGFEGGMAVYHGIMPREGGPFRHPELAKNREGTP